jgi:hypothetical protein
MSSKKRMNIALKDERVERVRPCYNYDGKEFGGHGSFVAFYPNDQSTVVRIIPMDRIKHIDIWEE